MDVNGSQRALPPALAPARASPLDDVDQTSAFDLTDPEPVTEYKFDQTMSW
jgi:hypothetical protein